MRWKLRKQKCRLQWGKKKKEKTKATNDARGNVCEENEIVVSDKAHGEAERENRIKRRNKKEEFFEERKNKENVKFDRQEETKG